MPVFDLFSKREKRRRGDYPDVYQYNHIPPELRVQIVHIVRDAFGPVHDLYGPNEAAKAYQSINDLLCREYGVFKLSVEDGPCFEPVLNFLLQVEDTENAIDVIEFLLIYLDTNVRRNTHLFPEATTSPDNAIEELNQRFREQGVGYQFESGRMIRVDSEFVHSEVVRPALKLLQDSRYKGVNEELLSAHQHFRNRKYKECLNDCLKAFESCLKVICQKRNWNYNEGDTASRLLQVVFEREMIPSYMQSHFSGLRSTLEAGVPTIRNRQGGHGQGGEIVSVPESIAAYALHLTASNILLLVRADIEMK